MDDFTPNSEEKIQDKIWKSIGQLEDLFSTHVQGKEASSELRNILLSKFNISSCSLFTYDLKTEKLYDMLQQAPIEFNIQTPFLSDLDNFLTSDGAHIFHSDRKDMSWIYTKVSPAEVMILIVEKNFQLDEAKVWELKGILKIWYMKIQVIISEKRRHRLLEQI